MSLGVGSLAPVGTAEQRCELPSGVPGLRFHKNKRRPRFSRPAWRACVFEGLREDPKDAVQSQLQQEIFWFRDRPALQTVDRPAVGKPQQSGLRRNFDRLQRVANNFDISSQVSALLALACVVAVLVPMATTNSTLLASGNVLAVAEEAWQVSLWQRSVQSTYSLFQITLG